MRRLLACLALAVFVGPAAACINDSELPAHEREFRSRYNGAVETPSAPPSESASTGLLYGAGGMLLVGAVGLTLRARQSKK